MSVRIEVMLGIRTKDIQGNVRHEWITDSRKVSGSIMDGVEIIPGLLEIMKEKVKPHDALITEQVSVTHDHMKCTNER